MRKLNQKMRVLSYLLAVSLILSIYAKVGLVGHHMSSGMVKIDAETASEVQVGFPFHKFFSIQSKPSVDVKNNVYYVVGAAHEIQNGTVHLYGIDTTSWKAKHVVPLPSLAKRGIFCCLSQYASYDPSNGDVYVTGLIEPTDDHIHQVLRVNPATGAVKEIGKYKNFTDHLGSTTSALDHKNGLLLLKHGVKNENGSFTDYWVRVDVNTGAVTSTRAEQDDLDLDSPHYDETDGVIYGIGTQTFQNGSFVRGVFKLDASSLKLSMVGTIDAPTGPSYKLLAHVESAYDAQARVFYSYMSKAIRFGPRPPPFYLVVAGLDGKVVKEIDSNCRGMDCPDSFAAYNSN
jgi:hypothetical protein